MTNHPTNLTFCAAALSLSLVGVANAGVVAHWSFDADFTDSSASSNDLSVGSGTPTITTAAGESKFGGGAVDLDYDGDWLTTASTISFGPADPWSVSFWGKKDAGVDARSGMVVGTSATNNFIWTPDNSNVVQGLRFRPGGGGSFDYGGFADDAQYHHWVVVADGTGTIRVYRDNVDLGTLVAPTDFSIDSVGSGLASTTNNYGGQLDEIYIFDQAIDAQTVASLFTSNVVPEPGSLALIGLGGVLALRRRR
ncbi:MAG: LamG-like jellyroll fold domain-containing protein [Phycisphaeraceae bacterium]